MIKKMKIKVRTRMMVKRILKKEKAINKVKLIETPKGGLDQLEEQLYKTKMQLMNKKEKNIKIC
jgi:hypothetical protein